MSDQSSATSILSTSLTKCQGRPSWYQSTSEASILHLGPSLYYLSVQGKCTRNCFFTTRHGGGECRSVCEPTIVIRPSRFEICLTSQRIYNEIAVAGISVFYFLESTCAAAENRLGPSWEALTMSVPPCRLPA